MTTNSLRFNRALVRRPGPSIVDGLRAVDRGDPSYEEVLDEHRTYVAALEAAGVDVTVLPALDDFPDAIFVEDPALVFEQGAVLLRPGAASRRDEAEHLREALEHAFDRVLEPMAAGSAEGGDILTTPEKVLIGLSSRTDAQGAAEVQSALRELGMASEVAETPDGVLHFKSDCSILDETTILATARLAASGVFSGFDVIEVPEGEEPAANALRVNDVVLVSGQFPRTVDLLTDRGFEVVAIPTPAIQRVDAGLSCMSLRWRQRP